MLQITLSESAKSRLKEILEEEDNDEAFVRIKEIRIGSG